MDGDEDIQQSGATPSHEYDFSDDFNISEVKDSGTDPEPTPVGRDGSLPKSLSDAVSQSLSSITKPGTGTGPQTSAPVTPTVPREPKPDPKPASAAPAARPDPFREPIGKLDTEWPFASPETLARHRDREKEPYDLPQKQAAIPADLPTTAALPTAIPVEPAPVPTPTPKPVPPAPAFVRPAGVSPVSPVISPAMQNAVKPVSASIPPVTIPPLTAAPTGVSTAIPATSAAPAAPGPGQHLGSLKNIRTYQSDVADALASRPVTKTSIALAESKKRGEGEVLTTGNSVIIPSSGTKTVNIAARVAQEAATNSGASAEKSHTGWKITIILLSLALIGGGVVGGYYLYSQSPLAATTQPVADTTPKHTPALVPYDSQTIISIDQANNVEILKRLTTETGKTLTANTIKEIVLTETREGVTYRVTAPGIILLAGVPVPDIISRTLAPEWMLGVYADSSAARMPFVVVHTNLFQNAFSGMLAWEPTMVRDLQPFLGIPYDKPVPKGTFTDQIIKNKDVRAFVLEDGSTLFEYSFIDNSTLVITGNNTALTEIISRLESKAFVR